MERNLAMLPCVFGDGGKVVNDHSSHSEAQHSGMGTFTGVLILSLMYLAYFITHSQICYNSMLPLKALNISAKLTNNEAFFPSVFSYVVNIYSLITSFMRK